LCPARRLAAFEVQLLVDEVERLPPECWQAHQFTRPHRASGNYLEVAVWTGDGPGTALKTCPNLSRFIDELPVTVRHARLARLPAGVRITTHIDRHGSNKNEPMTLHFPIKTHPAAQIIVAGRRYHMAAGELWFIDTHCLHSVANRGTTDRVHLILDCEPDAAAIDLLGFDVHEYWRTNLFMHHAHYAAFLRREQRWQKLAADRPRFS